jgi:ribonuclease HI
MLTLPSHEQNLKSPDQQGILWVLEFDGSVNKLGAGAGVWIHNKEKGYAEGRAYRLNFRCTNNMAEYEALLLGLKIAKSLQAPSLSIMGDSDLVIQQVKGNFVTNDKRLRSYRSAVMEILETFPEFVITKIPRGHNLHAHSLATFASTFKFPLEPNNCFTAEVRYRPSIPNNVREWQVFEDDMQINNFLTLQQEFTGLNIDIVNHKCLRQQVNHKCLRQQVNHKYLMEHVHHKYSFNNLLTQCHLGQQNNYSVQPFSTMKTFIKLTKLTVKR